MKTLATLALLAAVGSASAQTFVFEGNLPVGGTVNNSFLASQGSRITYSVWDQTGTVLTDTVGDLRDPSDTVLVANDDGGGGSFMSIMNATTTQSGSHSARMSGYPDFAFSGSPISFNYRQVITTAPTATEVEGNDSAGTANPLVFIGGAARTTASLIAGERDFFSFSAVAGTLATIETHSFGVDLDTVITIRDSAGTLIGGNDDGGPEANSAFSFIPTADGIYFAEVRGFSPSTGGAYDIVVSNIAIPTPGAAGLLGLAGLAALRRRR